MEKTEIQQSQELEKIKLSLGNNLLDANERKFLQSQEKLVLDFKEKTEQLLLQDIKAANEKSLISTANMRMAINWMLLSPEGFINQLSVSGKLGTNPMLISNTKIALRQIMVDKTITQIDKKMFLISILLDAKDGPINLVTYKALADSKLKNMTSGTLVKKIHAFQKIGKGSDCVIDESTLGQLCALSGIVPPQGETLTTFNIKTTEKSFSYASQAWDAMEKIVKNTSFTNVQKVTTLLDIRNKTSADKKYAATSYLMTFTQDILKNATVQEKTEIELLISQSQSDIAKYRNADESNDLVVKTNDIMKDINKGVEQKEQKIKSIESLHTIAGIRESFYKSYDKHLYEKKGQGITTGIAMLEKTKTAFAAGTISEFMCDAQVSYAMKKIFVSIEEDTESEIKVDVTITKDKDGNEYHVENTHQAWHNIQLKMFQSLPGLFQEGNTKEIATQIFGLIRNYDRGFINVMEATGIEYGELVEQGITQTTSFVDEMETVFAKGAKNNILLIKNFVATLKSLLNPAKRAELVNLMSAPATSTEQIITFLRGLKLGIDDQLEDLAKDLIKNSMLSIKNSVAALKIFLADAAAGGKVEKLVNLMSAPATSTEQIITFLRGLNLGIDDQLEDLAKDLIKNREKVLQELPQEKIVVPYIKQKRKEISENIIDLSAQQEVLMEELKQTSSEQEKNTLQTKIQELNAKIKFFQKVEQSDDKADVFTKTGGASFSLHDMAMDYRRTSCEFAFTSSLEWTFAKHIMLENEDDLKRGAVGGTMELYMDINGIGGYVSDTFYNNTAQVIKFAGEIALSCITFGAALSITASIQVLQKATWYWRLANLAAKALIFTLADVSIRSTLKGDFSERGSDFVKDIGKNIAVFAVLGRVKKLFELPKMLHLLKSIEIEERVVASRAHVILENITAAMGVGTIQVASDVISGKDIDAKEFLKIVGEIIAIGLIFNASKIRYGSKHIVIEGKVFETSEVNKYLHEINGIDHKIMQEGLTKQELQFQKERVSQTLKKAILEGRDIGEINFLTLVEKQLTTRLNPKATVVGKANVLLLGKSRVANLEHDLVKKEFGLIFEQLTGAFLPTSLAALGTALELSIAKLGNSITTEGLNNVTTTEGGNSEITTEGGNSGIIEKVQSLITELSEKIKTSEMTADSKLLALNDVEKIKEYVQTYE